MLSSLLDCCNCDSYIPSKVLPFSNPAWFIYEARVCLVPCLKSSITICKRQRELAFIGKCPLIRQIPIINTGTYSFIVSNFQSVLVFCMCGFMYFLKAYYFIPQEPQAKGDQKVSISDSFSFSPMAAQTIVTDHGMVIP